MAFWKRCSKILLVGQRHSDLQTCCLGSSCPHSDKYLLPARSECLHLDIFAQRIQSFGLLIDWLLARSIGKHIRIIMFQDLLLFILFHDVRVARHRNSSDSLHSVPHCGTCYIRRRIHRHLLRNNRSWYALQSPGIASGECNCRGISQRLLHVVHYIRHDTKILLRRDQATGIGSLFQAALLSVLPDRIRQISLPHIRRNRSSARQTLLPHRKNPHHRTGTLPPYSLCRFHFRHNVF